MKELEDAIKNKGQVLPGNILKVNSFLNHQIDPTLMYEIGKEFVKRFADDNITKVITVESSGIAPAVMTGLVLGVPVIFARKKKPSTLNDAAYSADVYSYTKQKTNRIFIEKKFISPNDNVLIIDDFLANGEATKGMIKIVKAAQAHLVGVGIVIEKSFQPGADWITNHGIHLESLARIASLNDNEVTFKKD
ncbi:xanthine phosphoribosyltransferase [Fructilactobacillus fructivorans]|uniref:Xanthine phosphoribosyltransferase n=1 Tax=Fructilactobacillus fructivorans TaxID=1614 RepID=A0A0C1PL24_9LACO|nr:xanthine phosphoribosyltransferase [Fructilactobacillus fructivorans]KID41402.1 Xanthine phosphoribosyltransferase [Fructilactobacillus fructivorans]MCT0151710.1 xanthine phosphoribosyltransferase [Fructilactobacillus fructivorans]MCT2867161.1 xanthine phosphoribosyltransferase [Fructilactobacillus fructivorans]MCT2868278.1 xanthine phosphoribosyltransferase [Fructilactobacillus fructivorans]MCT2872986.1 xanthine phosphoribosyltransferase [Fructilactobacillus fructivorans]